jgi:choline dehydrogenase-like flavoprotein
MKDSATFFIPFLADPRLGSASENNHALAQAFLRVECLDRKASQIQIYEYSDDLIPRAKRAFPLGNSVPDHLLKPLLSKLLVGIGYLHSDDSRGISMTLTEDGNVELKPAGFSEIEQNQRIRRGIRAVSKDLRKLGLFPILPLVEFTKPGEGVHSGGWLPMGDKADILGTPNQARNIHLVDSSIFPTIPAGAITFSVMANAVRIAEAVAS